MSVLIDNFVDFLSTEFFFVWLLGRVQLLFERDHLIFIKLLTLAALMLGWTRYFPHDILKVMIDGGKHQIFKHLFDGF
jgi:hypothetical protein